MTINVTGVKIFVDSDTMVEVAGITAKVPTAILTNSSDDVLALAIGRAILQDIMVVKNHGS